MGIITRKKVKVISRGRFVRKTSIPIIGPQSSFYLESVQEIGNLLDKYPNIKIVELLDDGRTANLTKANYDKDNNRKAKPVSLTEEAPAAPEAPVEPEKKEEEHPAENFKHVLEYEKKDETPVEPEKVEKPEAEPTPAEEPETNPGTPEAPVENNNQHQSKKDRKNRNKGNQQQAEQSTEVTPVEP